METVYDFLAQELGTPHIILSVFAVLDCLSSDRPVLEHGESIERDLKDLETTFIAPTTQTFVQSSPKEYQDMTQLIS
jgi:hypothetical protein